ncbi:hypothetical protein I5V54_17660 [Stenotrophomonas maltophilia]|nr:hypothetical protein [Stenotrophomonas maltophilia]MBH1845566.1 hypothetical protein [Stenotrophomonas maltophilia]
MEQLTLLAGARASAPFSHGDKMHTIAIFLVSVCTIVLSGCATTALPKGVASAGYTEVVSVPLGPLRYFYTASMLPGQNAVGTTYLVRCANTERTINLQIADGLTIDAEEACARVDAAAASSESWIPAASNSYRILLVQEGTSAVARARSLGRFATGRTLALVSPVYGDQHRTFANLVDLVAHESVHALGHATKHPRALDERSAYYAGLCAQLQINGFITEEGLPGAPLASGDQAVRYSSQEAYRVRLEIYPLLAGGGIRLGTPPGKLMLQRCQQIRREMNRLR